MGDWLQYVLFLLALPFVLAIPILLLLLYLEWVAELFFALGDYLSERFGRW